MSRRADERMGGRESSEDYLEAILVIRRLRGSCRNVDIAERMGVGKHFSQAHHVAQAEIKALPGDRV